jgi:carboxymethylenebutenolidase
MSGDIQRQAIALYDHFTHEDWGVDRSPGAVSDGRGPSDPPMDRREFMAKLTRLAGSAAAAGALLADVACRAETQPQVAADDNRLVTADFEWEPRPGRRYRGYSATLSAWHRRVGNPLVLVIHENRGLNDHIRDVTRRFALAGFSALAPDWLSPAGGTPANDEDRARTMIGQLDMAATVADGAATIASLGPGRGPRTKIGIVGFCWGGGLVDRLAVAAGETLSAAVSYYGPAPDPAEAPRVRAPILFHLAGLDNRVNGTARPFAAAIQAAHGSATVIEHPNVDHAFNNDTSVARYNREAATQAWTQTLDFFREHLE